MISKVIIPDIELKERIADEAATGKAAKSNRS